MHEYHLSEKFLIIVIELPQNVNSLLNAIFDILWRNSLINSQVLIQDRAAYWSLYTFLPYDDDCFDLSHLKIESFTPFNYTRNMTISMDKLFPIKLKNFNKCPLNVAVSIVDPFTSFHIASKGNVKYKGIDIDILNQISKNLNFVAIYKRTTDGTNFGLIFPNGTVTGNMKLVCW